MNIGDTITVPYEESRKLRKEGWQTRNDVVVMTYVGKPEPGQCNYSKAATARHARQKWSQADHDFVARKLAGAVG